jgi:hypothetical protein
MILDEFRLTDQVATSSEYFSTALRFNTTAPFVLSRLAAQAMVDTDGAGSNVNISSRSGDMVMTVIADELTPRGSHATPATPGAYTNRVVGFNVSHVGGGIAISGNRRFVARRRHCRSAQAVAANEQRHRT